MTTHSISSVGRSFTPGTLQALSNVALSVTIAAPRAWKMFDAAPDATPHVVMSRAWLGLKALAWAWLRRAWAFQTSRPGPRPGLGLGSGLAWLRSGLLNFDYLIVILMMWAQYQIKVHNFRNTL
jgi:hypothetical protein